MPPIKMQPIGGDGQLTGAALDCPRAWGRPGRRGVPQGCADSSETAGAGEGGNRVTHPPWKGPACLQTEGSGESGARGAVEVSAAASAVLSLWRLEEFL